MKRKQAGLILLVLGAITFFSSVGNLLYQGSRVLYAKSKIPTRIYEIDDEMKKLEEDPNSDVRAHWKLLGEAIKIEYEKKFDLRKCTDEANKRVEIYNNLLPFSKVSGPTGLTLFSIGYFLRKDWSK